MKVLVIGKGGREHALVWKIAQSPKVDTVYAAPGNPGMAAQAQCVDLSIDTSGGKASMASIDRMADFVQSEAIDLTVVGPEDVLSVGLVDRFAARGLKAFGPKAAAARIETSKAFSKALMERLGVPTARHRTFTDQAQAESYIRQQGAPIVVKASGLAAGKGAIVAHTESEALAAIDAMMADQVFGDSGAEVVIEAFMTGDEATLLAITDGEDFVTLVPAQDHKAIYEGDKGPNTGGMGAYAPAPIMTPERIAQAETTIIRPVLDELRRLGTPFQGVLYCGLMMTPTGMQVVEFNCRFGDPETQVILPLLATDFVDLALAVCDQRLDELKVQNAPGAAVCVVVASQGYPGEYPSGLPIGDLNPIQSEDTVVFHAGTALKDGHLVTAGGRVLCLTATAATIPAAVERAYAGVGRIQFSGAYFRRDIAHRALAQADK